MEPFYQAGSWRIEINQSRVASTEQLESLNSEHSIKAPSILFLDSFARLTNEESGLTYYLNTTDALSYCKDETRSKHIYTSGEMQGEHINIIPEDVKVKEAWIGKKVPKNCAFVSEGTELVDVQTIKTNDWTFTSPYKGLLQGNYTINCSEEDIPLDRLGMDNPILWAREAIFYMDDLDDRGQSTFNFRIRAMKDCFFGLIRSYIRVDDVLLRILDTRIFHSFDTKCILREFQHREVTYQELIDSGHPFQSQWVVDERESDLVFEHVPIKQVFKDKITY